MQGSPRADPLARRLRRRRSRGGRGRAAAAAAAEGVGSVEDMVKKGGDNREEMPGGSAGATTTGVSGSPRGAGPAGPPQVVRVKRELLATCMTCPLCHELLRDATTISECLHTFCRKCIYEKLMDEEVDCCPICNIDLGCTPVEKLRADHNLQDIRAKIFPFKIRKLKAPEVVSLISLPIRRKERSLSSLVVSTPQVATHNGLTGRRTKVVARKSSALRGLVIDEPIKKEEDYAEDRPGTPSSPEPLSKTGQNRRQNFSSAELSNHSSKKDTDDSKEPSTDKTELWKPLNCLVEAANRTKSLKSSGQSSVSEPEQGNGPQSEINSHKTKVREHPHKWKLQDDSNSNAPTTSPLPKVRRVNGVGRKRSSASREIGVSAQALLDAASVKHERRINPIWFSLIADSERVGDAWLPQISACYLRIKDGNLPVSFIQKYLAKKLDLANETEVEITCRGQAVVPTLALHKLVDLWLQTGSSHKAQASVGTSAKDFVMVLVYARKVPSE